MKALITILISCAVSMGLSVDSVSLTYRDSVTTNGMKLWTGTVDYRIDENAWVSLELSTDSGNTFTQRLIHGIGDVGFVTAGKKTARWLIDGDHGSKCRIRVRANNQPLAYSLRDADNNKFPFPVPDDEYKCVEGMTGIADGFNFSAYNLPPGIFYVHSTINTPIRGGFAKIPAVKNWTNPANKNYYTAAYFDGGQPTDKYLLVYFDLEDLHTDECIRWKDSIEAWTAIPAKHIYFCWSHTHLVSERKLNSPSELRAVIDSAIIAAEPLSCTFTQYDMQAGIVHNREVLNSATGTSLFTLFDLDGNSGYGGVELQSPDTLTSPLHVINGTDGSVQQRLFDGPQDSRLQFISFRNANGDYKGVFMKMTGHNIFTTKYMDSISLWMGGRIIKEGSYDKVVDGPVVSRFIGFGGNHFEALRDYPVTGNHDWQAERTCAVLRKVVNDSLKTAVYSPLYSMAVSETRGVYGCTRISDTTRVGKDLLGTSLMTLRFNDIFLTSAPSEAPSQQGIYIRGRLYGKKVMYNGYANGWYMYYRWGRYADYSGYGGNTVSREGAFQMAQDIVRSVNLIEP
jgi:hypothetical protein